MRALSLAQYALTILLVVLIFCMPVRAQVADSLQRADTIVRTDTTKYANRPFSISGALDVGGFILVIFVIPLIVVCACLLLGAIAVTTVLFIFFALVTAGFIATPVIVALYERSLTKGFRVFILLLSTAGGIAVGMITLWILNMIYHWYTAVTAIGLGMLTGLVMGVTFGFVTLFILKKLTAYFKVKLGLR